MWTVNGVDVIRELAECLKNNTSIKNLCLSSLKTRRRNIQALFINDLFCLTESNIGDEGTKVLSEILQTNTCLNTLNISSEMQNTKNKLILGIFTII